MADQENSSSKKEDLNHAEKTKPYVLLALIEHGSRPAAIVVVGLLAVLFLFSIKEPLLDVMKRAEGLKYGTFELRIRVSADLADLAEELKGLEELNEQQIQLFMIVGIRDRPHIRYFGEEVTEGNLEKLQALGLLSGVKRLENGDLYWEVTEKGHGLHELIFNQVVRSIRDLPES